MKKFLFVFIFFLALGTAVFFLGWAQLTVPPGSYGVMRSKTHGLESQVIRDGEFRWIWYKAIPTNARVSVFNITPFRRPIKISGSLPSGQVYADLAGIQADFSWELSGELSFRIRPEFLPELSVKESIQNNDDLRILEENFAQRIENLLLQRVRVLFEDADEEKMTSLIFSGNLPELDREIQSFFPEIDNLITTIRVVRFPDFALYQALKSLYQEYLYQQNVALRQAVLNEAERRIETRLRLDELTRMGELLTRFPILLQYLALESQLGN